MPSASRSKRTAVSCWLCVIGLFRWSVREWSVEVSRRSSDQLDDRGDAHAAADAQRGQAAAQVAAQELVDERDAEHRTGGTQGMAHGDRTTVDVGDLVGDAH